MYAHCVAQFQFASVGTQAWEGTYGIPLPGIEPCPFFYPYPQTDGFNSSASYTMRAVSVVSSTRISTSSDR